jgi:hypothetical protein
MAQANDVQTAVEPRRENGEQRKHEHELSELAARENIGQDLERIRDRIELALHEAHGARQQAQQSRSRAQQAHKRGPAGAQPGQPSQPVRTAGAQPGDPGRPTGSASAKRSQPGNPARTAGRGEL